MGANHFDNDRGKGYLYMWEDTKYELIAEVTGRGENARFGDSAAISGDCQWVAWDALEPNVGSGYVAAYSTSA